MPKYNHINYGSGLRMQLRGGAKHKATDKTKSKTKKSGGRGAGGLSLIKRSGTPPIIAQN